jgi:hypothetical protein
MWHVWETRKHTDFLGGGKSYGRKPLGRPRYRWEDNIKMDPK